MTSPLSSSYTTSNISSSSSYYTPLSSAHSTQHLATSTSRALNRYSLPPSPVGYSTQSLQGSGLLTTPSPQHLLQPYPTPTPPLSPSSHLQPTLQPPTSPLVSQAKEHIASLSTQNRAVLDRITRLHHSQSQILTLTTSLDSKAPGSLGGGTSSVGMGSLGGGTSSGGWGLGSTTGSTTTDSELGSSAASASALQALRHRESEPWLRASHWDSDAASSTHSLPLAYQSVPAYGYIPQQQLQPSESDHGERARRAEVRDAVLARLSAEKGRLNGMLDGTTGGSVNSINSMTGASSVEASATQYTNNVGSGMPAGRPANKPNQEAQLDSRYFDGGMQDGDDDEAPVSPYTTDRDDIGPRATDGDDEIGLEEEDVDDDEAERARRRYSGLPPVRATTSPQPPTMLEEEEREQQQMEEEEEEEERGRARKQRQADTSVSRNAAAQLAPPSSPRKRGDRSTSASGRSPKLQPITTVTPPPAAPADNGSPLSTPLSSRASSRTRSRLRYGMSDVPEDEEDTDTGYENPSATEETDRGEESCFEVDEEVRVIMRGQPQHPSQQRSPGSTASVTTGGSGGTASVLSMAARGSKVPLPKRSASASSGQETEPKSTSMVVSKSTSSGYKSGDKRQRALAMANAAIVSPRRSLQGYRPAGTGNGGEVEEEQVAVATQQDNMTVAKTKVARVGGGESGGQRTRTGIGTLATTQEQGGAGSGVGVGTAGAGVGVGAGAGTGTGGTRKSGAVTQRNDGPMSPVTSDGNRSEAAATGSEAVGSPGTEEDPFWDELVVIKSRIRRLEHERSQVESEPGDDAGGGPVSPVPTGSGQQRPHGHQKQISLDSSITSPRMRASSGGRNLETPNGGGYETASRAGTPSSARLRRTSLTSTALSSEIYMPHNMRSVSRMESPVSPSYRPSSTAHQKHLQDAFEVFERAMSTQTAGSSATSFSSSQASSPGLGANGKSAEANMAHTMATIVSTALALNQTLRSIATSEINASSGVLLSMQKTSDEQVRSLTESLLVLSERGIGFSNGSDRSFTRDRDRERRRRTISGADSAASIRGGLLIPEPTRDDDQPPRPATVTGMRSRGVSPYYNGTASPPPDQPLNGRLSERRRYAEQLGHERIIAPPQPLVYRNDRLSPPQQQQDAYFDELPSPRDSRNNHLQVGTDTLSPTGRKRSTSFTTGRRDADGVTRHVSPPLLSPSASSVKSVGNVTVISPASNASPATPRYSARAARILNRLSSRESGALSPTPPVVVEAPPTPQPTRSTSLTSSDRPAPSGLSSYRRYEPLRPPADDMRSPLLRPSMQLEASRKAAAEMGYDLMNTNVRGEGTGVVVQGDGARARRARRWSSLEGSVGMIRGIGDVSVRHEGAQQETKAGVTSATGSRVRTVSVLKRGKAMGGRVTEEEEGW
ncbi:hypothetical protein BC937DRAFT_92874 [Endogone sp. FLAS-F59071]|nr:hypothetical protein BC937DRAFT_92874 [Endogone sp. FLAS-F59071]|eukprot:RUS15123.1 hypothetical protein BC937DRAFT_92874 [Endogone sp. FLAS-F59071]